MRKLILDTETTGLDFEQDRIIEVACIELEDDTATGQKFHSYYSPGDIIISEHAEQIHGLSNAFLRKYDKFEDQINEFLNFVGDSPLIIHNAQFDLSMINNALKRLGKSQISKDQTICTLEMAKKKFPGSKNNLNALCRRFDISLESRVKHGALTDCELLLDVYIELLGGKQEKLSLAVRTNKNNSSENFQISNYEKNLVQISREEETLHQSMLAKISNPIWSKQEHNT
ncbi:MAG: DNA polymerase III subunit epsilon [Alphaproteobacteria bacterium MarineAlpha8_Bin1]|nr:MAG: DNA polymerase III subunit epsilon [Alphaproteobacteria bacterium MarineAlpha8_Bin1]|tara:strand:- start:698 stop:1384 length:687 start_codon:yes stop_codon:yes gene_type:complete